MRTKVEQISEHHFQYKVRKFVGDVDTPFVGEAEDARGFGGIHEGLIIV